MILIFFLMQGLRDQGKCRSEPARKSQRGKYLHFISVQSIRNYPEQDRDGGVLG